MEVRPVSYLKDFEKTLAEKCHQNEPPFCQGSLVRSGWISRAGRKVEKGTFQRGVPDLSEYGGISGYCVEAVQPSVREGMSSCEAGRGDRRSGFRAGDCRVREAEGHRMRITCRRKEKRRDRRRRCFRGLAVHCVSAIKSTR